MIILVISLSIVVITVWAFHRKAKRPQLRVVEMEWSPLSVDWLDEIDILSEDQLACSDETGGAPHANQQSTPSFSELFDQFASPSHSEPDVVRQEPDYFAFPGTAWEQNDCKDATVALTCPVTPSDGMLDAGDPDVFVSQSSESTILPLHEL